MNERLNKMNERLEQLNDTRTFFATKSEYDIKNLLKNKPKFYRLFYDPNIKYWLIAFADDYTHRDMVELAQKNGLYYNCKAMKNYMSSNGYVDIDGYMYELDDNEDVLRLWFTPDYNKSQDLGVDGFNYAYIYDFGTVMSRYTDFEGSDLQQALGDWNNKDSMNEDYKMNEKDDRYYWKQKYVDRKNAENAEIETLTEEQHEVLAWLCEIRHEMHTNQEDFFWTESSNYDRFSRYLWGDEIGYNDAINTMLAEVDLPTIKFSVMGMNDEEIWRDELEEKDIEYGSDEANELYSDYLQEIYNDVEKINKDIENYLGMIDEKYGTSYAPTGIARARHFGIDPTIKESLSEAGYDWNKGMSNRRRSAKYAQVENLTLAGKILKKLNESEVKTDNFTKYYDSFNYEISKFDKASLDTNDNGINRKELRKITGLELEDECETLTPAQKSYTD